MLSSQNKKIIVSLFNSCKRVVAVVVVVVVVVFGALRLYQKSNLRGSKNCEMIQRLFCLGEFHSRGGT